MIHYICVATKSKLYFPYLKQLIPQLVVLGMGMKWTNYSLKIKLLMEYLETLKDDDIVCFIDAYDVLPTNNIVKLERQFVKFINKNSEVKMIVGGGVIKNRIQKIGNDLVFEKSPINSGTYIGYVKQIKHIWSIVLEKTNISDDQVELIKYAKKNPKDIYIDSRNDFFCVVSKPLKQVNLNGNKKCSFIHANGNGCLEDFLLEHHDIYVDLKTRIANYTIHLNTIIKKVKIYTKRFILQ